MLKYHIS